MALSIANFLSFSALSAQELDKYPIINIEEYVDSDFDQVQPRLRDSHLYTNCAK